MRKEMIDNFAFSYFMPLRMSGEPMPFVASKADCLLLKYMATCIATAMQSKPYRTHRSPVMWPKCYYYHYIFICTSTMIVIYLLLKYCFGCFFVPFQLARAPPPPLPSSSSHNIRTQLTDASVQIAKDENNRMSKLLLIREACGDSHTSTAR